MNRFEILNGSSSPPPPPLLASKVKAIRYEKAAGLAWRKEKGARALGLAITDYCNNVP